MNRSALYAVTAIAILSFAGQALARGGDMAGRMGGTTMTTHMTTTQPAVSSNSMQHGTMQGSASMQGGMAGTAANSTMQGGSADSAGHQSGMKVNAAKPATKQ